MLFNHRLSLAFILLFAVTGPVCGSVVTAFEAFQQKFQQETKGAGFEGGIKWLGQAEENARSAGDDAWEILAIGHQAGLLAMMEEKLSDQTIERFRSAIDRAKESDILPLEAFYSFALGHELYRKNSREKGLVLLLEGLSIMAEAGYSEIPGIAMNLYLMGEVFFDFDNYEKAINYYLKSLEYEDARPEARLAAYNKLAAAYTEIKSYPDAEAYFQKGLELTARQGDSAGLAMISCNLGILYLELERLEEADSLLTFGLGTANRIGDQRAALCCLLSLVKIDLLSNDFSTAASHLAEARHLIFSNPMPVEAWLEFYERAGDLAFVTGRYKNSALFRDSVKYFQDSIAKKRDANLLANLNAQVTATQHQADLQVLQKEKEYQKTIRNSIVWLSILVVGALIFMILKIANKRKRERIAFLHEKKEAEKKLLQFSRNIRQKNEMIDFFREQLELSNGLGNQARDEEITEQLYKSTILTEDDWIEFRKLFEKVYPGFISNLQRKNPELTSAEIRLLALLKLNLSVAEIGAMLGILPQSVRKTRSRVMKKLRMEDPKKIPVFLEEI